MTTVSADARPLSADELELVDAWWRASNYLAVGQIYLLDNPLLREPLKLEHIKARLLGHWGTTPYFVSGHVPEVMHRGILSTSLRSTNGPVSKGSTRLLALRRA